MQLSNTDFYKDIYSLHYSIAFPLPELTASGCRVTFHKVLNDENCLFDVRCIVKYLLMLGDIRLLEEGPISGDIVIFDAVHAKASMVSKLINPIVKKGIMCSQVSIRIVSNLDLKSTAG